MPRPKHWPSEQALAIETAAMTAQATYPFTYKRQTHAKRENGLVYEELSTYLVDRARTPEEKAEKVNPYQRTAYEIGRFFHPPTEPKGELQEASLYFGYFGCLFGQGHYLHGTFGPDTRAPQVPMPWGPAVLDSTLCPDFARPGKAVAVPLLASYQEPYRALLHHQKGWTAVSFWDRTGDTRYGSNSTFLAEGDFSFEDMLAMARTRFRPVMERYAAHGVQITLITQPAPAAPTPG